MNRFAVWSRSAVFAMLLLAVAVDAHTADDIIVIVNNDNAQVIDQRYVQRVYTGVSKAWPDGSPVFPLDQDSGGDIREAFCEQWLGRSPAAVGAIWAQNIFTGKALPPKIVAPDEQMKRIVATNRNAIGYIRRSSLDAGVKAVLR
jgi:ABC-type phosphate transport system substrate-binding protein